MPIYHLACRNPDCAALGQVQRRLLRPDHLVLWLTFNPCPTCHGDLERAPHGPATRVVERLDNGAMEKVVERPVDVHELVRDHAKKGEGR